MDEITLTHAGWAWKVQHFIVLHFWQLKNSNIQIHVTSSIFHTLLHAKNILKILNEDADQTAIITCKYSMQFIKCYNERCYRIHLKGDTEQKIPTRTTSSTITPAYKPVLQPQPLCILNLYKQTPVDYWTSSGVVVLCQVNPKDISKENLCVNIYTNTLFFRKSSKS